MEFCVCAQYGHTGTLQALRAVYECVSVSIPILDAGGWQAWLWHRMSSICSRLLTEGDVKLSATVVLWIVRPCSLVDT